MIFASPAALWLLLLLAPLGFYAARFKRHGEPALGFSRLGGLNALGDPVARAWERARGPVRLAALAFLLLALARPQQGLRGGERDLLATDILLCLDVSHSMLAEDLGKDMTRLHAAKAAARAFIEKRDQDRLGLVLFGEFAMTFCPLTTDLAALAGSLDQVEIGAVPGNRTAIGDGLATSVERLKATAARSKVIVLLTDGSNNAGAVDPVTAAKAAQSFGIKVYAIGAGAPGGGFATVQDPVFGARRVRVGDDLDEEALTRIATATGGQYFRATDARGLRRIFGEIDALEKTELKTRTFTEYLERFEWFLLPGALLAAAELGATALLLRGIP